jgi:hypothetical protein
MWSWPWIALYVHTLYTSVPNHELLVCFLVVLNSGEVFLYDVDSSSF